jgi:hypothetical protein
MHHNLAQFVDHGRLLNLFFGSSQTNDWLPKYGHFKFWLTCSYVHVLLIDREKNMHIQVRMCMCMYQSVYVYICTYLYCICLFYQDCKSEHYFCSVSRLLPRRCACRGSRAWKLAGCGHDSSPSLRQEKSREGGAWPAWNCMPLLCPDAPVPQCPSGGMECAECGNKIS